MGRSRSNLDPERAATGPRATEGAGGPGRAHRSLLKDMRLALRSEFGARAIYEDLARGTPDPELRSMLLRLSEEGQENAQRLQELMRSIGGRPRRGSLRRRTLARALALGARVVGVRPVLRICLDAEQTVGRWYHEYGAFFARLGDRGRARLCAELAARKEAHARAVEAWVTNLRRR